MREDAMTDLFALTPLERKRMRRRASETQRGHAWTPGTGPAGETCGTCDHRVRVDVGAKTVSKCGRNRAAWTGSIRTDVRACDVACKLWEPFSEGGKA
jgi:hypothetical protein